VKKRKFETTFNYYDCVKRGRRGEKFLFQAAHGMLDNAMNKKLSSPYFKKERPVAISITVHLKVEA
jgi:hypothetical protein